MDTVQVVKAILLFITNPELHEAGRCSFLFMGLKPKGMLVFLARKSPPEGGWGWMVVWASFVFHFFSLGTKKALGVFVPQLGAAFDISDGTVGTICGLSIGVKAILGPVWAAAAVKWNARGIAAIGGFLTALGFIGAGLSTSTVQLTISLALTGIGLGLPSVALLVIIRDYFDTKFNLATGMAYTGSAIGMTALPPLVDILITQYGWRAAFILLGALCFNICAVSALYRPLPSTNYEEQSDSDEKETLSSTDTLSCFSSFHLLGTNPLTSVYFAAFTFWSITYIGWMLFLVSYGLSLGYSSYKSSLLSTLGGVGTLLGRSLTTFTDTGVVSGQTLSFILSIGAAASLSVYPWVRAYWILGLVSLLVGFFLGTQPPVQVVFTREMSSANPECFADALGLHYVFIGFGNFIGGPLTGFLYDITGDFSVPMLSLAGLELLSAIMIAINAPFLRCIYQSEPRKS